MTRRGVPVVKALVVELFHRLSPMNSGKSSNCVRGTACACEAVRRPLPPLALGDQGPGQGVVADDGHKRLTRP
jgi:hypothetical protein